MSPNHQSSESTPEIKKTRINTLLQHPTQTIFKTFIKIHKAISKVWMILHLSKIMFEIVIVSCVRDVSKKKEKMKTLITS